MDEVTYIGAFLTFRCGFNCSYCINKHGELNTRKELTADEWIEGLNRLKIDRERKVPITLQGGEPSRHKGFLDIINGVDNKLYLDILTNLDFNIDKFIYNVDPKRLQRDVPYASIRVSYHPKFSKAGPLLKDVLKLQDSGFDIGVFAVEHPTSILNHIQYFSEKWGIDFRTKEFLGFHEDKLYGKYKYPDAINGNKQHVLCKTTELLIAPDGNIHKCHRDLYAGEHPIGHILGDLPEFEFRACENMGCCNPCDIKLKNNRFQEFGSCSVEIRKEK